MESEEKERQTWWEDKKEDEVKKEQLEETMDGEGGAGKAESVGGENKAG